MHESCTRVIGSNPAHRTSFTCSEEQKCFQTVNVRVWSPWDEKSVWTVFMTEDGLHLKSLYCPGQTAATEGPNWPITDTDPFRRTMGCFSPLSADEPPLSVILSNVSFSCVWIVNMWALTDWLSSSWRLRLLLVSGSGAQSLEDAVLSNKCLVCQSVFSKVLDSLCFSLFTLILVFSFLFCFIFISACYFQ